MTDRFIHFSSEPLLAVADAQQAPPFTDGSFFKPRGLWFSVEREGDDDWMGWQRWCNDESFRPESMAHRTEVIFKPMANVLHLSSAYEIDALTTRWRPNADEVPKALSCLCLDWPSLCATCDAIIISPYIWERRLDGNAQWYYAWDCASGCVWNSNAIDRLVQLT